MGIALTFYQRWTLPAPIPKPIQEPEPGLPPVPEPKEPLFGPGAPQQPRPGSPSQDPPLPKPGDPIPRWGEP
jgi:hypothetical protein